MKRASITEVKNNLSALIDSVQAGSPILIVDRGRPVARLEPVQDLDAEEDDRLARLVRAGVVRPGSGRLAETIVANAPPRARAGASVLQALIDERREGR
jgi:prevent-host-death family protein